MLADIFGGDQPFNRHHHLLLAGQRAVFIDDRITLAQDRVAVAVSGIPVDDGKVRIECFDHSDFFATAKWIIDNLETPFIIFRNGRIHH